jgi:hypothetical protein
MQNCVDLASCYLNLGCVWYEVKNLKGEWGMLRGQDLKVKC